MLDDTNEPNQPRESIVSGDDESCPLMGAPGTAAGSSNACGSSCGSSKSKLAFSCSPVSLSYFLISPILPTLHTTPQHTARNGRFSTHRLRTLAHSAECGHFQRTTRRRHLRRPRPSPWMVLARRLFCHQQHIWKARLYATALDTPMRRFTQFSWICNPVCAAAKVVSEVNCVPPVVE
jgi:hypothetical protein